MYYNKINHSNHLPTHIIINVQKSPKDPDRILKAFGKVVIVALYRREYKGAATKGVRLSSDVISANSFPISSLATTEAITERVIGDPMLLKRDSTMAKYKSAGTVANVFVTPSNTKLADAITAIIGSEM